MTRAATDLEDELEDEFEAEYEGEFEDELDTSREFEGEQEDEDFLPVLGGIANAIGGLLGEEEGELEDEYEFEEEDEDESEDEYEYESEEFLGALGPIARAVGGLLGGGGDGESELEEEYELESEAEEFFKGFGRLLKRAAPVLRTLAKTAGPLVATAVGGPAAGALARAVTSQLEGEFEEELESEFEEMATAPMTGAQALGEYLAAQAASAATEGEAEAMAGVAAYMSLRPRDRRDLERMLPALLRGTAVLTRLLRSNRHSRPAVRLVPGIVDGAARAVLRRGAAGRPISPLQVARALGSATNRVLGRGPARRGRRPAARAWPGARPSTQPQLYGGRGVRRPRYGRYPRSGLTVRRQPVSNRTLVARRPVTRPRPGFVRIVTPVRVPSRNGRPAGTVRVVSDVRVPRGAVPVGRPSSVSPRRARTR